ncbi:MAG: MucBP domain-containing protein, partial [Clostridia bacterium]|nr:MucBP domain-containing protein [Clostridia bacterium]
EIEGYDIVEEKLPGNSEGTMSKEEIEVRYYYIKKTKVIVEYIDKKTGNKLTEDVVINGHEGDNYMSENKNFEGYDFVEKTDNTSGKMTREDIVVKYYYDKKPEEIVVKVPENPQPENTEKPSKPADNNNNHKPINTPNTGDNLPVIAVGTISLVIFINILQIIILNIKKKKQDR